MSSSQTPKRTPRVDRLIGADIAGKYKIIKKIGEGGMGSVYIANQHPIDRKVAIKVLLSKLAEDEVAVKRFEQEAKAISRMQHPNTVTIYDFGQTSEETEERLYIVMEYLRGRTLTQVLRAEGQLEAQRAARIVRQVCASLADAHAAGIIHRDLKPDNIFLTEVGGDKDWVKVLDFGVAKLADSDGAGTLTQTGMIFGTPKYMSPEQAEGRPIDYRADIYALGVVLFELLVGRPPFVADTPVGLLLKHISEPPPSFSQVRPDLQVDPRIEAIVMRALDKRPEGRQQMVSELAAELEAFERAVSGAVPVPGLHTLVTGPSGPSGLPTEVNAGQQAQMTPQGLNPPGQVPSGLSLGEVGQQPPSGLMTGPVGPPTGNTARAGGMLPTADLPNPAAGSRLLTAPGITQPSPAAGDGIDTIGGLSGEIADARPTPTARSSAVTMAGVVLLIGGIGLGAFLAMGGGQKSVQVDRMAPLTEAPSTPTPEELNTGRSPPPLTEAVPEPSPPPASTPKPAPPPAATARPRAKTPPPPPPPSPLVMVRFDSEPTKAKVVLKPSGRQLGFTPFKTELPRNDLITVVFSKRGFKRSERTFATDDDRTIRAELTRRKKSKRCADGSRPPCQQPEKVNELDLKVDDLKGF